MLGNNNRIYFNSDVLDVNYLWRVDSEILIISKDNGIIKIYNRIEEKCFKIKIIMYFRIKNIEILEVKENNF